MPSLKLEKSFGPLQLVCQLSSRVRIFSAKTVSKGEQATSDQCDDHGQIRGRDHTTLSKLKCALESQRDGGPIVCSRKSAKKILILIGKHAQCPAGVSKPIVKACEALEHALWKAWEQMNSDLIMAARIEVQTEILDLCPVGHADRATSCQSLASSLKILYDYTEDLQLLEKAIQLRREVLERNLLTPSGHPMPYASAHLAVCLKEHFVQSKDIAKLEEAVMLFREALRLCSSGHSDRVLCSGNLAAALQTWSKHTGEDESLNAAIELYGEALDLCPSKNPHRARLCRELAIALGTRFEQTGDTTLLDKAISLGQEAMKLCPPGHPNRAKSCQEFGDLLTIRFDTAEDIGCFDAALGVYREVLDIYPPGHRLRADACASLAMLLRTRYIQIGQKALLDEAIKFGREAFDLSSPGDPNRAWFCGQHVTSLTVLFRHTQEVEVLDEAINLSRKELAFHSEGNLVREMLCNNLATSLVARFNHMGGIASLDNAIGMLRAELAARSPTHLSRAHLYTNLAIALRERFEQTGESTLLQEIIQLDREALDLRPFGHCNRALSCDSLAESLARYFEDTGDVASLNEALHHYKEALALRPPGHSERASSCNSLAVLLMTYYEASSDNTLLARAIEMYEAAYDLHSPGSPNRAHSCWSLAEALLIRLPTLEGEGDRHATMDRVQLLLEQAREPYPVGHPLRWRHFHTLAMRAIYTHDWPTVINQMREIMDCTVYDNIHLVLHSASTYLQQVDLDALSSAQKHALLVLCGQAIGRMHLAVMLPINASTQLKRVHVAQSLGYRAFMLAVAIGEVSTGVQLLEHARGVVWSQMLHRREPKLDKIPDEFAHMLRTLLHSDRGLQLSEGAHTRDHQYAQRGQIQEVVRKIRLLPGMDSFMQGPSTEALMSVVDFSTVIMLVATDSACYAVVMASSGKPSVHVLLLDLNAKMLSDLSFAGGSSFHRGCTMEEDDAERGMRVSKGMSPSHTRLAKLWRAVVKPVISHLQLSVSTIYYGSLPN
jgi:tetratricopeptide (TPR) repeat protein